MSGDLQDLSRRELDVLELVAYGLSNEGVSARLGISVKSVEGLCRTIFLKLGLGGTDGSENRRVKATIAYLQAYPGQLSSAFGRTRQLDELIASGPYDSIVHFLTHRSSASSDRSWTMLGAAAWFATIAEQFDAAGHLARESARLAEGSAVGSVLTRALVATIDAICGRAPLDHAALDALAAQLFDVEEQSAAIDPLVATVEVPNWFTFADRFEDASRLIDLLRFGDRLDTGSHIALLGTQAEFELRRCRVSTVEAALDRCAELSAAAGAATGYVDTMRARLSAIRGDAQRCRVEIARGRRSARDRGDRSTLWRATASEGLLALSLGDAASAAVAFRQLGDDPADRVVLPSVSLWAADAVEAFLGIGDEAAAVAAADRLRADSEATGSLWGAALSERADALLAADGTSRTTLARRSAGRFRVLDAPFEQARSLLIGAHDVAAPGAREAAFEAVALFDSVGAEGWAAIARQKLESL